MVQLSIKALIFNFWVIFYAKSDPLRSLFQGREISISNWASDEPALELSHAFGTPQPPVAVSGNVSSSASDMMSPTEASPYAPSSAIPSSADAALRHMTYAMAAGDDGGGTDAGGPALLGGGSFLQGGLPTIREGRASRASSGELSSLVSSSASPTPPPLEIPVVRRTLDPVSNGSNHTIG